MSNNSRLTFNQDDMTQLLTSMADNALTIFSGLLVFSYFVAIIARLRVKNKTQISYKFNMAWITSGLVFISIWLNMMLKNTKTDYAFGILLSTLIFMAIYMSLD